MSVGMEKRIELEMRGRPADAVKLLFTLLLLFRTFVRWTQTETFLQLITTNRGKYQLSSVGAIVAGDPRLAKCLETKRTVLIQVVVSPREEVQKQVCRSSKIVTVITTKRSCRG